MAECERRVTEQVSPRRMVPIDIQFCMANMLLSWGLSIQEMPVYTECLSIHKNGIRGTTRHSVRFLQRIFQPGRHRHPDYVGDPLLERDGYVTHTRYCCRQNSGLID